MVPMMPVVALCVWAAGIGERFVGEKLCYDGFLFKSLNVGEACISFERGEGEERYAATIVGRPNSLAKNFTHVRMILLRTYMMESRDHSRLLPYRVERELMRDTMKCGTVYVLMGQTWTWTSSCNGRPLKNNSKGEVTVPSDTSHFDDPVSAVYNLRADVYGERRPGTMMTLTTLSWNGKGRLTLGIFPAEGGGLAGESVVYRIGITQEGDALGFHFRDVLMWVGPGDIPLRGTLRGGLPFLDIKASLQGRR